MIMNVSGEVQDDASEAAFLLYVRSGDSSWRIRDNWKRGRGQEFTP